MASSLSFTDLNVPLTPFGHTVQEAIHEALQNATGDLWLEEPGRYDTEDEDAWEDAPRHDPQPDEPEFTKEATKLIGAHVALVVEKCREGRKEAMKEYVKSQDAKQAIYESVEAAKAREEPPRKKPRTNPQKLREQICRSAGALAAGLDLAGLQTLDCMLKDMMEEKRF